MSGVFDHRREFLRAGVAGWGGLSLPGLLASRGWGNEANPPKVTAEHCLFVFMEGGPAHQDLWDMKPEAPLDVRGEFKPISSSLPGQPVCEHLPLTSQYMHLLAQVRSIHHKVVDHNAGSYYALTGRSPVVGGRLIISDEPDNFPNVGSVMAKLRPTQGVMPSTVLMPEIMSNNGYDIAGQRAGFLGTKYDPLVTGDPSSPKFSVPGLGIPVDVSPARQAERRKWLNSLEKSWDAEAERVSGMADHYRAAFELLTSDAARKAFAIEEEPLKLRERYGLPDRVDRSVEARKFGGMPHLGQTFLLARRLIESGVRLVTLVTGRRFDQAWDTHRDHFPLLKQSLLPYFDRAFSALLQDLEDRGLLQKTLIVVMGEFGRTPRLGQITSGAGAAPAGRDHWPHCYTALFAGGGVQPGAIIGASDKHAAYPLDHPVTPEDVMATIYRALGVSPETRILDSLDRPHHVALGTPITELF